MRDITARRFLDPGSHPTLFTLTFISGVSALAMNVFLPAMPAMAEHFGTSYQTVQLALVLYFAMNAVLQVLLGPLSDRFGRRPVLLWSFAVFLVATVAAIFAPNITVFLIFRMVQAAVVTGMVLSRAVVRDMVPGERAASLIAYVTMGMALVPMFAPALGGFLAQSFGWEATFWLQFVVGALAFALMYRDLGETLTEPQSNFRAQIAAYPELLLSPRFWAYSATVMFATGTFYAYLGGAPFVGAEIFGLEPGMLGFALGAPAIGYLFGNGISGRYATTFGINNLILAGNLFLVGGLLLELAILYAGYENPWLFFLLMTSVGFGNGMAIPNGIAGYLGVRPALAGSASGLGGAMMIGGGAVVSAFAGSVMSVEAGAYPLVLTMLASAVLAVISILYIMQRERREAVLA